MSAETTAETEPATGMDAKLRPVLAIAWIWVASPFAYGLYKLFQKIDDLFS